MNILGRSLTALAVTGLFACDAGAGPGQATAAAAESTAAAPPATESCLTCHAGPMGFAGKDSDAIAASLRDIVSGARGHPPLGLQDTSDAALEALAERLTSP